MNWTYLLTSFDGRINREPFWTARIMLAVVHLVLIGIVAWLFGLSARVAFSFMDSVPIAILNLMFLWPSLALNTKRWHDRDKSGWWNLLLLIPVIGAIWMLVEVGFLRGTNGPNRFGPDPLVTP